MKKVIGIILVIAGLAAGCLGITLALNTRGSNSLSQSVAIIGGADGPTSTFVAVKTDTSAKLIPAAIASILLVIAGIFIIISNIKKQED